MYKRTKSEMYLDNSNIQTRAHQAPLFKIPKSETRAFDKSIIIKGGTERNSLSVDTRSIIN